MNLLTRVAERLPLALIYFVTASLAAALTRFDGGVAFLWVASAFLIADLVRRRRDGWMYSIIPCALASAVATGLFGLGWALAVPLAVINMTEAFAAAWLFRRLHTSRDALGSLSWVLHFILAAGLVSLLVGGTLAGLVLAVDGMPGIANGIRFLVAHSLGNLMVVPLALLIAQRSRKAKPARVNTTRLTEGALLLGSVVATSFLVFSQNVLPLLFLPILPVILTTFRLGRGAAAAAVVIIALIGGGATIAGFGPVQLIDGWIGSRTQFFQLYLAATVLTVLPVAADLENRRRLLRAVRLSENRYRLLADHSSDILLHLELDGRVRYVSPSMLQLGGYYPAALVGRNSLKLVAPQHVDAVRAAYKAVTASNGDSHRYEYLALTADGSTRWFETQSRAIIDDDGQVESILSIARDISDRKAVEERLTSDALTDALTGLPNRRSFRQTVERRLVANTRSAGDSIAVLDIDHFKRVNDIHGHAAGDEVLLAFGRIARRMVRDCDMVARIGGEEFAILFPDTNVDQAMVICNRLRSEISRTLLPVGPAAVRVTVSGGVAALGFDGLDAALATADRALYDAKRSGRDRLLTAA